MSRIGIIGSLRTSPVKTLLGWLAMVLPFQVCAAGLQPAVNTFSDCNACGPKRTRHFGGIAKKIIRRRDCARNLPQCWRIAPAAPFNCQFGYVLRLLQ
jgi:hypothetical protein